MRHDGTVLGNQNMRVTLTAFIKARLSSSGVTAIVIARTRDVIEELRAGAALSDISTHVGTGLSDCAILTLGKDRVTDEFVYSLVALQPVNET